MEIIYMIIPAYNEAENIESIINDWYPIIDKHNGNGQSRLVVINDGSKDNTYEILKTMAKSRPYLEPITKQNSGHGSTVLFGYRYAIKNGADWIFQTDSDGQTDPLEFDDFWNARRDYDAIIGNRVVRGDGLSRKLVENIVCFLLWCIFRVRVKDANAPFRLMRTSLMEKYIDKLPENYNLPNIMLTTYFVYFKEKIKFLPITFKPRQGGSNTINIKAIIKIGLKAVGDFAVFKKRINDCERIS